VAEDIARIFIAIELPVDVVRGLDGTISLLRERVATPNIKWVAAGNIHVTLKFLGDVPGARIDEIERRLEPICAATPPMRLSVAGLGAFPSARAPRVVWAGLQGDIELLSSLARSVDAALVTLGYPAESRPFTPHLTLARVRQEASGDVRARLGDVVLRTRMAQPLPFQAGSASIMRSQLTPRGAVYNRLAHLPFGPIPGQ
jgi:2'-5' RNA ligase